MFEADPFVLDSENYRYGFLAAALEPLLRRQPGHPLTGQDLRSFESARQFLSDVVAGAKLISEGQTGAVTAEDAMAALGYALGPIVALDRLRESSEREDLLHVFKEMLGCVEQSILDQRLSGSQSALSMTADFFGMLNRSILSLFDMRSHPDNP